MKQKISFPLAITLIVVLSILAVVVVLQYGFILRINYSGRSLKQPLDQITEDETSDWKTYRNEEVGYEIKYPQEFGLKEYDNQTWIGLSGLDALIGINVSSEFNLYISNAAGYIYGENAEKLKGRILLEEKIINEIPFQADYFVAYHGMGEWEIGVNVFTKYKDIYYVITLEKFGGYYYEVSEKMKNIEGRLTEEGIKYVALKMVEGEGEFMEIFNKILSTFKFIETEKMLSETEAKSIVEDRAIETIIAIKDKSQEKLSNLSHPNKGVRFSPYTYVSLESDLVFSAGQLLNFFENENIYIWGTYDGSGFPIDLTPLEYYDKFIYSADFLNPEQISYNRIIGKGNTINNTFEIYPNSIIVEYYFSGFDLNPEGFDWRSLKLVFEEKDDIWYLIGVINDHWTI